MQQDSASYNYHERYDPLKGNLAVLNEVEQTTSIQIVLAAPAGETRTVMGINNAPPALQEAAMTRSESFLKLTERPCRE
jgi:hypothetical protein